MNSPPVRIVHAVTATSMAELRLARDAAEDADLVELRLDGVRDVDVAGALEGRRRPVIVTCRPTWEGGRWDGGEEGRRRIIDEAVRRGAEYVDVERRAQWRPDLNGANTRVVLSDHDFSGVPDDLADRVTTMRAEGVAVVKVAATPANVRDVIRLRALVEAAGPSPHTVVIGMGEAGVVTRLLPGRFGSCWTYGGHLAPGQVEANVLRHRYRSHLVTPSTRIFGVVGAPIRHSASPAMHNAAFVHAGIDATYVPLLATTVDEAAAIADALGLEGLSVTAPLKLGWLERSDVVGADALTQRVGAVNTLRRVGTQWQAMNCDVPGFLDGLDLRDVPLASRRVLVLGAGGSARAVVVGLTDRGARVSIAARRSEAAESLAGEFAGDVVAWPPQGAWDVVVNTTPVGTWPETEDVPVNSDALEAAVAYDLVYNPEETRWLRHWKARGAVTIGGMDMLAGQAARQFEWWTGQHADAQVMRRALRQWVQETAES